MGWLRLARHASFYEAFLKLGKSINYYGLVVIDPSEVKPSISSVYIAVYQRSELA